MATYIPTQFSLEVVSMDLGIGISDPYNAYHRIPIITLHIKDEWADRLQSPDELHITPEIRQEILEYAHLYPTAGSVGGSDSQWNASTIKRDWGDTYPIYTEGTMSLLINWTSYYSQGHVFLGVYYNDNLLIELYSNRSNGRVNPLILIRSDNYIISFMGIDWEYDGGMNSFNNATIYGLPIFTSNGMHEYYLNIELDTVITQFKYVPLSELDYVVGGEADPYVHGTPSTTGGGTGSASATSDTVDFPSTPTLSASETGFITLYNPSLASLRALATYMWNQDPTTIDFWKKIVGNPIDLILGLNIVPVAVPNSGSKSVVVGAINTNVVMTYTDAQYVEVDCGSLTIPEYWGSYLDYAPYTRYELYLPYCGTHPLIADEVVGKTVSIKYHVDILSGSCVAYVKCGDSVLYQFSGNCASQIPVTSNQFSDMIRSAISIASAIGTMVATDGATAPMAVSTIASMSTNSTALKPSVEKSGAIGGTAGQLAIQKPYLIVSRPSLCIPEDQNKLIGYPSFINRELNSLHGYTEISSIHLENVPATGDELNEIESILKSGVIL